jgi:predicted RNA methylase
MIPHNARAIMNQRREPPGSLDFFPTPPWCTRALLEHVIERDVFKQDTAWDPCCGEGHMAAPLEERFGFVWASDIFPYGYGALIDFLDRDATPGPFDWIVMNPPFNAGVDFALRALQLAQVGVAVLARSNWAEGQDRYDRLFNPHPPTYVAAFVERVGMARGRWDPDLSTATAYSWFVWILGNEEPTRFLWIPPGRKDALTRREDFERFAHRPDAPLLEGLS